MIHGISQYWDNKGIIHKHISYNNGLKHGLELQWDNRGKLLFEIMRLNGSESSLEVF